jgi:hypothetical protein
MCNNCSRRSRAQVTPHNMEQQQSDYHVNNSTSQMNIANPVDVTSQSCYDLNQQQQPYQQEHVPSNEVVNFTGSGANNLMYKRHKSAMHLNRDKHTSFQNSGKKRGKKKPTQTQEASFSTISKTKNKISF